MIKNEYQKIVYTVHMNDGIVKMLASIIGSRCWDAAEKFYEESASLLGITVEEAKADRVRGYGTEKLAEIPPRFYEDGVNRGFMPMDAVHFGNGYYALISVPLRDKQGKVPMKFALYDSSSDVPVDTVRVYSVEELDNGVQLVDKRNKKEYIISFKAVSKITELVKKRKQKFYVTYAVNVRYVAEVNADSVEEAKRLSEDVYSSADFGELTDIVDNMIVVVEDQDGNIVWEA